MRDLAIAGYLFIVGSCLALLTLKTIGVSINAELDLADLLSILIALIAAIVAGFTLRDTRERRNEDKKVEFLCEATSTIRLIYGPLGKEDYPSKDDLQSFQGHIRQLERLYRYLNPVNRASAKAVLDEANVVVLDIQREYLWLEQKAENPALNEKVDKVSSGFKYQNVLSQINELVLRLESLHPHEL